MNKDLQQALENDSIIDITTTGRKSGEPRRIEIRFYFIDGQIYISGMPSRKRNWLANLSANPAFIFHLKQDYQADIPAGAVLVSDEATRRAIFPKILATRDDEQQLEEWIQFSPLVEVHLLTE